jgi:hypothetical protein
MDGRAETPFCEVIWLGLLPPMEPALDIGGGRLLSSRQPMNERELEQCHAALGVEPGITREAMKKIYLQKSYALIRAGAPEEERERLRAAHDDLVAHLDAEEQRRQAEALAQAKAGHEAKRIAQLEAEADGEFQEPELRPWDPRSFDSWRINALTPPLVAVLAILAQKSFVGFFLTGFHVWVHELGHATIGWMTGHRALPLPIGWTPIAPEKSNFVYFGVLFLLALMFVAGLREKKVWPMVLAIALALLQAFMTWRLPQETASMWIAFGGVGGEFYLAAAMMGLFYFQFPEKFRWGVCRYLFLFIGAASFFETYTFWKKVKRGDEGIPFGSMINGEEDAGGDMNGLHDEFGWTQHDIIYTYNHLADACLVTLIVVYAIFALRLDRLTARLMHRSE